MSEQSTKDKHAAIRVDSGLLLTGIHLPPDRASPIHNLTVNRPNDLHMAGPGAIKEKEKKPDISKCAWAQRAAVLILNTNIPQIVAVEHAFPVTFGDDEYQGILMELRQTFISGIGPENSLFAQKPLEASNGFRTVRRNGSSSWEGSNQKQSLGQYDIERKCIGNHLERYFRQRLKTTAGASCHRSVGRSGMGDGRVKAATADKREVKGMGGGWHIFVANFEVYLAVVAADDGEKI
ncbi:hypothetical protein B0H14DRAFT_3170092 [Mycena olivaceomarginata]|nr:hypothetical protein B0H14DRAFT_3170092 [Mycena olivaceomarginata]